MGYLIAAFDATILVRVTLVASERVLDGNEYTNTGMLDRK